MNLKKNEIYETTITGMTTEGSGVGRIDGTAVFITNTAIGDIIKTKIIKTSKNYAIGRIEEIISPSPDRTEPDCKYFSQCGGCTYRHITYEAECQIKQQRVQDAIARIAGFENLKINPIVGGKSRNHYRNKAQLPVGKDSKGNLIMGFYAYHSHRIVDSNSCNLQPDEFTEISKIVKSWTVKNKIQPYNEATHTGLLRHLYIRIAEVTGEIMVCLVINGNSISFTDELINQLKAVKGFKSLQLNINKEKTNVVLGKKCITLYGCDYITDILCGLKFNISPLSFYQVNRTQAENLYSIAQKYAQLKKDDILLDLYCGTGTIGLSMAHKIKKLIGVEIIPQAIENAKENAKLNNINNAEFICADASTASTKLDKQGIKPTVIIVDPPRKGCDKELIATIVKMSPKRVVYVSCDSATMARDIKIFNELGYTPREVTPVDMFPGTSHIECVVLMSRADK
ncbi:MAG: 23S rRNA (uracil(1939)-C(5))-methyltransferase RlmD [Acutalibacteraceae bacterium]|nr:23S rRNA (uracil(1939)-C(5))-methyltransferase RlmD [Acutalibacteraceae bacterium]